MGRTKGNFGSSSPRGASTFAKGGKLSTKSNSTPKRKLTKRTKCK